MVLEDADTRPVQSFRYEDESKLQRIVTYSTTIPIICSFVVYCLLSLGDSNLITITRHNLTVTD